MGFELRFSNNPVAELTKHFETSENSLNFQECHSKSVHVNISCHLSLAAQVPSLTLFFFFIFFFWWGNPRCFAPIYWIWLLWNHETQNPSCRMSALGTVSLLNLVCTGKALAHSGRLSAIQLSSAEALRRYHMFQGSVNCSFCPLNTSNLCTKSLI